MLRGAACTRGAQEVQTILLSSTSPCRLWQGWLPQFRLILAQKQHCQGLSAHCERDGAEQAAAQGTESPGPADAQAGCRWHQGQFVQTEWSPDKLTQALQSGSWLGRKVEQPAALLTLSLAVILVCSTARAVCAAVGTERRLCPPCRCPWGCSL